MNEEIFCQTVSIDKRKSIKKSRAFICQRFQRSRVFFSAFVLLEKKEINRKSSGFFSCRDDDNHERFRRTFGQRGF
jgi:hypothetical protein